MNKICSFVGTSVGGGGFRLIGEPLGAGFFACLPLSGVGGIAGVWAGRKIARRPGGSNPGSAKLRALTGVRRPEPRALLRRASR